MPDDINSPSGDDGSSPDGDEQESRTIEQVEAEWRGRMSGKDRAHAAEVQTLRNQLVAAQAASSQASQAQGQQVASQTQTLAELQAANQRLQDELSQERAGRVVDVRKLQFPQAAESIGDLIATMQEEQLAALEQRLGGNTGEPSPAGRIESNSAPRTSNAGKLPREKTTEELIADLARFAPEFEASLKQ